MKGNIMTELEIKKHKEIIDKMSREEMAKLWRFAPTGHAYFNNAIPLFEHFNAKFKKLGGFNTAISKKIGLCTK